MSPRLERLRLAMRQLLRRGEPDNDWPEPDEPPEWELPRTWTHHDVRTADDGSALVYTQTNDNNDDGYPDARETAWEHKYSSLQEALRVTGTSRRGITMDVFVHVDGEEI